MRTSIWEQVAEDLARLCEECRTHQPVAVVSGRRLCGTCWVFIGRSSSTSERSST